MKAARYYAAGDVRIEEVDVPTASDDHVLIAVEWCGICGSDLNEYIRGPWAIPSNEGRGPHPLTGEVLPITMGHELSGRVVKAPPTSSFLPGQAVVVDPRFYCSSCGPCNGSATNCCQHIGFLGLSGGGGGLSEMIAVSPEMVHLLPDEVDLAAAALIEPLAVGWHAVSQCGVRNLKEVPVLVVGGGPVGVSTIFVLKAWGATMIIVSEVAENRREFLGEIADAVFDPTEVDLGLKCRELTGGKGVGVVFDCAGTQEGFKAGCDSLKSQGTYANLAIPKIPLTLPFAHFISKELTFKAFLAYNENDFKETVTAFNAGHFAGVERMITRRVHLEDIVEKGFKELTENAGNHIKILATARKENWVS
ncbi:hypothetical protein FQN55_003289 [Onygenales sp. PD_40]|nr:hypothetical protein FQN55_003289 [Onygenales sp. PD_40]KAK2783295.1 hypothetical protein FQN53_009283 [Emmonsiellopsis sp. PD_33]